jgi:hypothetical protein
VRSPWIRFPINPASGQPESANLTGESGKPANGLSRRHMLAGVAVLSATGMPADASNPDPILAAIEAYRCAHAARGRACDVLAETETRFGFDSEEADAAFEAGGPACHASYEAAWALASTRPTTLVGIAAVLHFANEIENTGHEWPEGGRPSEGWRHQLRASIVEAIESVTRVQS